MSEEDIIEFIKRKNIEFDIEKQRRDEEERIKIQKKKEEEERKQAECDTYNEKEVKPIIIQAVSDHIRKNYDPRLPVVVYFERKGSYITIDDRKGEQIPISYKKGLKAIYYTISDDIRCWLRDEFGAVFDLIEMEENQIDMIRKEKKLFSKID